MRHDAGLRSGSGWTEEQGLCGSGWGGVPQDPLIISLRYRWQYRQVALASELANSSLMMAESLNEAAAADRVVLAGGAARKAGSILGNEMDAVVSLAAPGSQAQARPGPPSISPFSADTSLSCFVPETHVTGRGSAKAWCLLIHAETIFTSHVSPSVQGAGSTAEKGSWSDRPWAEVDIWRMN